MTEILGDSRRRRGRGGGGAARRAAHGKTSSETAAVITREIGTVDVLDAEAIERIEDAAETVLEEIGVNFLDNPGALARWRDAGADVQGERVYLPRGLARKLCETAPQRFTQIARNPAKSVEIGGNNLVLAPVYGPPFVLDLDGNRRYATLSDFHDLVKLGHVTPWLHHSGGTVCEPTDVPANKRHLDMLMAHMTLTDKPFMGAVTEPERARHSVEMCEILFGADRMGSETALTSLINVNSPLTFDATMMGALEVYAGANQACILSPFIVGGAMSPVSVAGTLVQALAEVMVAIAYSQLIRPGAPVVFGAFVTSIDMNSGAPTFGTPEAAQITYGAGQLARRLGLPYRSAGAFNDNATAIGTGAQALHDSSTAIGTGAATTTSNQVAIGRSTDTVEVAGLATGTSQQSGTIFLVTADDSGTLGRTEFNPASISGGFQGGFALPISQVTEAQFNALSADVTSLGGRVGALETQVASVGFRLDDLDRAMNGGVAAAMAMGGPAIAPGKRISFSMSVANYQGEQAIAGNLTGQIAQDVYLSGGVSGNTGGGGVGTEGLEGDALRGGGSGAPAQGEEPGQHQARQGEARAVDREAHVAEHAQNDGAPPRRPVREPGHPEELQGGEGEERPVDLDHRREQDHRGAAREQGGAQDRLAARQPIGPFAALPGDDADRLAFGRASKKRSIRMQADGQLVAPHDGGGPPSGLGACQVQIARLFGGPVG